MKRGTATFFLLVLFFARLSAQVIDTTITATNGVAVNSASDKLLKSISDNAGPEEISSAYYNLSEELVKAENFPKAEFYMNKAIASEKETKAKKNLSIYYRELARIQESQNKNQDAAASYKIAAQSTNDTLEKSLNTNDANRLLHFSSPQDQLQYLNANNIILTNTTNSYEKIQNYNQLANTNIALNNSGVAMQNYRDALITAGTNNDNSIRIKSNMVNLLTQTNDFGSAVDLQKEIVDDAKKNNDAEKQVIQLRNLSNLYFRIDSNAAGLQTLQNAYDLAVQNGNLRQARESAIALGAYYTKNNEQEKASQLYSDFVAHLNDLVSRDKSLIDRNLFLINEEKISELEKQKRMQDELMHRTNIYNYVMGGSLVLISAFLLLIARTGISLRKKNKQIALQSLRKEMNPHFIFNSLNSVNQFIANNNEREANKYLTSYSNLMRNIMENSNKDYVSLAVEMEQLKKYLELEKLRFPEKFDYEIEIDPSINPDELPVPNMIIQPNLENAIWHGLRYKESKGLLKLKFQKENNKTVITIEDNGIGLTESKKIKTKNQKLHESLGLKNVQERIRLLNEIYKSNIGFTINEKNEGGVIVQLRW